MAIDPQAAYSAMNTLDVRHFTHHAVTHPHGDELKSPRELGAWMSQRGLLFSSARVTSAMLQTALEVRTCVRDYLQCDPVARGANKDAAGSLNKALKLFPLVTQVRDDGGCSRPRAWMRWPGCHQW
jgi:hypothetical protein